MFSSDIIKYICKFLSDKNINNYLSVTKTMLELKHKIKFNDPHILTKKINKLKYYDSFTNLIVSKIELKYYSEDDPNNKYLSVKELQPFKYFLPKNLTKIKFEIIIQKLLLECTAKEISVIINDSDQLKFINNTSITNLIVNCNYDKPYSLPKTIKYLKFENVCFEIKPGDIPESVLYLKIGRYDHQLLPGALSSNIVKLSIRGHFNFCIGSIPSSVTYLKTNNITSDDYIPSNVTHCEIDNINSTDDIKKISVPTITHLIFSKRYDQGISNIPPNITHLTFKFSFNESLRYLLPQSLTHLILPDNYNCDIHNTIPAGIKYLTIPKSYRKILEEHTNLCINYI